MHFGPLYLPVGFTLGEREREYKLLLALVVTQGFSWFMVLPMLPLYAEQLGATPTVVGLLMGFSALFQLALCIPGGLLASQLGIRRIFQWSFGVGVLAAAAFYLAPSVSWLFLAQFLFGTSHALFWPSYGAYLGDLGGPENRGQVIAFAMGVNAVSLVIGPAMGGLLLDSVRPNILFVPYLVLVSVGFFVAQLLPVLVPRGSFHFQFKGFMRTSRGEIAHVLGNPTVRFAMIGACLLFVLRGVFDSFFPLYTRELCVSPSTLGLLLALLGVVVAVFRFTGGRVAKVTGMERLLLLCLVSSSLAIAVLPVTRVPLTLALGVLLVGTGPGLVPVAVNTLITGSLDQKYRPVGMAINEASTDIGRLIGSTAFGFAVPYAGYEVGFATTGLLVLLGVLFIANRTGHLGGSTWPSRRQRSSPSSM